VATGGRCLRQFPAHIVDVVGQAVEQRYLSVSETAAYMGLSRKTIYAWAEKGAIPAYKVGRVWRFDKIELDDVVRGQMRDGFV
jgi:excisionase family DNA binding protein